MVRYGRAMTWEQRLPMKTEVKMIGNPGSRFGTEYK